LEYGGEYEPVSPDEEVKTLAYYFNVDFLNL
jgi:hypothetical protein